MQLALRSVLIAMSLTIAGTAVADPLDDELAIIRRSDEAAAAFLCGDYAAALKIYRALAEQGVPQDYVLAHMRLNLAAVSTSPYRSNEGALNRLDALTARMTPAQIAEAQRLARERKPTQ